MPLTMAFVAGKSTKKQCLINQFNQSIQLVFGNHPVRRSDCPGGPPGDCMDQAAHRPQRL